LIAFAACCNAPLALRSVLMKHIIFSLNPLQFVHRFVAQKYK
jgi:hypothetical protein